MSAESLSNRVIRLLSASAHSVLSTISKDAIRMR